MDYEKLHKDTINTLRQMVSSGKLTVETACDICADFVPETDAERIKRDLYSFLEAVYHCGKKADFDKWDKADCSDWMEWVEKQGEQKPITDFSNLRTWKYIIDAVLTEKEGIGQYLDSPFTEELANKLQKRFGNIEQKSKDSYVFNSIPRLLELIEPTNKAKSYCQKLIDSLQKEGYVVDAEIVGECLKQMNGEKVAMATMDEKDSNDIKPKFKVGDWVVYKENTYQIHNISLEKYYECLRTDGTVHIFDFECIDSKSHLWTINDAKDGDVLNSMRVQATIIFKGFADDGKHILAYCALQKGIFIKQEMLWDRDFEPCPKNWNNELFSKMKEAGYEWDAERKELCPLSKSEATSDSVTQTLVDTAKAFLQALSDTPYNNTPIVEAQIITKQLLTFLSDPKAFNPDAINNHESAEWSEEDEQLIDEVAVCLRKYAKKVQGGYSKFYVQSLADRIESLRPGNTCKATGWSEEDEVMYQGVIETEQYMLDVVYGRKIFLVGNESIKEECTKELVWLKSLKDRIK